MAILRPLPDILLKISIKCIILVRLRRLFCRIIGFFNPSGLEDIGQNVKYLCFAFLQICKKKFVKMLGDKKTHQMEFFLLFFPMDGPNSYVHLKKCQKYGIFFEVLFGFFLHFRKIKKTSKKI